jgi:hypothetical protein
MDPIAKLETAVAGVRGDVESLATESVALQTVVVDTLRDQAGAADSGFRSIVPAAFEDDAILPMPAIAAARPRKRHGTLKIVRMIEQLRVVLTGGSKPEQLMEKPTTAHQTAHQQVNSAQQAR